MGIRDWFNNGRKNKGSLDSKAKMVPIKLASIKDDGDLGVKVEWDRIEGYSELDLFFINVSKEELLSALDSWRWLPLTGLTAFAVSSFGEVYFSNNTGEIFHLDTLEGMLSKVAKSKSELVDILQEEEAQDKLLLGGFVLGARVDGKFLDEGECYDFKIAPVLGGPMTAEQVEKTSFVVKLNIAGQIHGQIKDLPPGTKIDQVIFQD